MAHPAARVLSMLELLQAHRRLTVGELSARLAVDERTVRRYAATLTDLGIPVTAVRGRYGGYRLLPGFKLPPLMFTDDEAVAVVLGLLAADRVGLATGSPAAASAEAKLSRVLPARVARQLGALRASLGFTMRDASESRAGSAAGQAEPGAPSNTTLLGLGEATRARRRLTVDYRSRGGEATRRDFDPYGLVFHSGRWYAVGHDHRSGEVRSFRVDRIAAITPAGPRFEPPAGFDAVAHLNRQWARRDYHWKVHVLLHAGLDDVRRRVPPSVAELSETPYGVEMRLRAQSLRGTAVMLAGLGMRFSVVTPGELRDEVLRVAGDLIRDGTAPAPDELITEEMPLDEF